MRWSPSSLHRDEFDAPRGGRNFSLRASAWKIFLPEPFDASISSITSLVTKRQMRPHPSSPPSPPPLVTPRHHHPPRHPPSLPSPPPSSPLVTTKSIPSISAAENRRFREFGKNGLRTDQRTHRRTDGPTDGRTDQRTDRRTDGRTDPLIEMRGRI